MELPATPEASPGQKLVPKSAFAVGASINEAVDFFFANAPSICNNGKMLRCQMSGAHALVYALIIMRDKKANPTRIYAVIVPDQKRALDAFETMTSMSLNAVLYPQMQEEEGDIWILTMEDIATVADRKEPFRIKVVEEVPEEDRDDAYDQNMRTVKRCVMADLVLHFAPCVPPAQKVCPKGQEGQPGTLEADAEGRAYPPYKEGREFAWRTMQAFANPYAFVWKAVIRPPRSEYDEAELGANPFLYNNRIYEREDFELDSVQGYKLVCSYYYRFGATTDSARQKCVVYLHGNCSSRLEALYTLPTLLCRDISVLSFDFAGSGRSGGEFTTLGYYEEQDIGVVVANLRTRGVKDVGLWGRSMGASAAVLRAAKDHELRACVLDSGFADFEHVVEDFVASRFTVPPFFIAHIKKIMSQEALARAGFDPLHLKPELHAHLARCPVLLAMATDDNFILPHHSQRLHNAWGGDRQLVRFDGGHSGRRPKWFLEQASDFLLAKLSPLAPGSTAEGRPVAPTRRAYVL